MVQMMGSTSIDPTHYPVFHQTEGVCLVDDPADDLRRSLFGSS